METSLQKYLDRSVAVLQKLGINLREGEESQLATLLQDVAPVDEPRVLAIAKTVKYMGTFNQMVRDNVEEMNVSQRYDQIREAFDSIRDDSKMLAGHLADGQVDWKEKLAFWAMKIRRGTTHDRFEKIRGTYTAVSKDTKAQLDAENEILGAYIDFRFALKDAEILAQEVLKTQETNLQEAGRRFQEAAKVHDEYQGNDAAEKSRLQLGRDEAQREHQVQDRRYQLIKDVAENLTIGYNVGETLIAKLQQTHNVKDQVYRRAVTFFTTNEHVFTTLDAVYTSQRGLHEATQTLEAMKDGVNKGLEDIADLGRDLEKAALQAGYGTTINAQSVQKLVDAIVSYQVESQEMIGKLRQESKQNSQEIARIVDEGKQRYRAAITRYLPAN